MTDYLDPAEWIAKRRKEHALAWDRSDMVAAYDALPKALDALEAVLERHRLNSEIDGNCQGYTSTGYGYLDRWCVECSKQTGREYGAPWPCPTVAAITEALS